VAAAACAAVGDSMNTWQSHFTESELRIIESCQRARDYCNQRGLKHNAHWLVIAKLVNIVEEGIVNSEPPGERKRGKATAV
jgi:hypothetical protein